MALTVVASHTYTQLTIEAETYFPNMTSDVDRMAIRKNWDKLMPREFGFLCPWLYSELVNILKLVVELSQYQTMPTTLSSDNQWQMIQSVVVRFLKQLGHMLFTV